MQDTLLNSEDFADKILSFENNLSDASRQRFRENCHDSWDNWTRQSKVVTLGEAKKLLDAMPNNFLYDRRSGLVWVDLQGGYHHGMMAHLYLLYSGSTDNRYWTSADGDAYILEGHGIYMSSVGECAYKGAKLELTRQEKIVFSSQDIRNLDDD